MIAPPINPAMQAAQVAIATANAAVTAAIAAGCPAPGPADLVAAAEAAANQLAAAQAAEVARLAAEAARQAAWLAAQEAAGGHSIARHGPQLTDAEMQQRVLGTHPLMPQSRSALNFSTPRIHQQAVSDAYAAHHAAIQAHFAAAPAGDAYIEFTHNCGFPTGTGHTNTGTRKAPVINPVTSNGITITFQRDATQPSGFRMISAFPTYP